MPEPSSGSLHLAPPTADGATRSDTYALIAIAAAGIALVGLTILRHEMWRDELQAWQIARASHGYESLVHNMRYEGHPILWYALLYPLSHLHSGPGAMQLLQFVIASATISIGVWRSPFTLLQKALFVFGYFMIYEYGALSRSYGLGALLIVIMLSFAATRERRPWPVLGLFLGLIALTSAFDALVAIALLAGLGVDEWLRRRDRAPSSAPVGAIVVGGVLTVVGLAAAYLQAARPPANTGIYNHWRTDVDVGLGASSAAAVWRALVPIPALKHSYWNTNILNARAAILGLLGVILFVAIAWILRDRPGSFVIWFGGVAIIVGFLYARLGTATASRHLGHIYLCLVAAMWLADTMKEKSWTRDPVATESVARQRSRFWTALLVVQLIGGLFAISLDLVYPFSNGRDVASYIEHHGYAHDEIIALPDTAGSTVAGYLDRPLYYLAGARSGTYVVWDTRRLIAQPLTDVMESYRPGGPPALLVINAPLVFPALHLKLLTHFDNGIVPDEHYWVYLGTAKVPS